MGSFGNEFILASWNLPKLVLVEYEKKGISEMFPWQIECLSKPKVMLEYRNLVYTAPASAGKSLVSEILILKTLLERNKRALYILPFISIVREKTHYLQDILSSSGYRVEGFFGCYSPPGALSSIDVAVCTIEKANSIVNRLVEKNNLDEIGIIVVDEIHLLSDESRGYILELLLTKVMYICKMNNVLIQIVCMSATLPNCDVLSNWLNAEVYKTSFRPVELHEMIKLNRCIYGKNMKLIREIVTENYNCINNDQDNIVQLCIETVIENCSVIIFCPSKDWCETLCLNIANSVNTILTVEGPINKKLVSQLNQTSLNKVKQQLENCPTGLDSILKKTIPFGCAFHHAGLTTDEREIIELSFKNFGVRILVATSTLSSGVNLPARRVIIRTPLFGSQKMNSLTYKQMVGRAGRTGKDTLGESILICNDSNIRIGKELVLFTSVQLNSCLLLNQNAPLKRAFLEVICSGIVKTNVDLQYFFNCTLLSKENAQLSNSFQNDCKNILKNKIEESGSPITESLQFLLQYEFIHYQFDEKNDLRYIPTRLGLACLASSMSPDDGLFLLFELQKARQNFVLDSELHAVYLVTPHSICNQLHELDWLLYLDICEKLQMPLKRVGTLIGVTESSLIRTLRGQNTLDYKNIQIHKRFYIALALYELINEVPISQVALKYKCNRGILQILQQMASTFAGIVTTFCTSLNWTMLSSVVKELKERLFFGINPDLIDLLRIPVLNVQRARALFVAGITNLIDLANANSSTIAEILYNYLSFDFGQKQANEADFELDNRMKMRNFYMTGNYELNASEGAILLISAARQYLEKDLGIATAEWGKNHKLHKLFNNSQENIYCRTHNILQKPDDELTSNKIPSKNYMKCKAAYLKTRKYSFLEKKSSSLQRTYKSGNSLQRIYTKNSHQSKMFITNMKDPKLSLLAKSNKIILHCSRNGESRIHSTLFDATFSNIKHSNSSIDYRLNDTFNIIDVCGNKLLFESFWFEVFSITRKIGLCVALENKKTSLQSISKRRYLSVNKPYVVGVAIYISEYENSVFFINLLNNGCDRNITQKHKIEMISKMCNHKNFTLQIFDAKKQLYIIRQSFPDINKFKAKIEDPKIAHWLLLPHMNKTLKEMISVYIPHYFSFAYIITKCNLHQSLNINSKKLVSSKIRSSIESYLTFYIMNELYKHLLQPNISMMKIFQDLEMPLQITLLEMEIYGFAIDIKAFKILKKKIIDIMDVIREKMFTLYGSCFNLSSSWTIAKVFGLQKIQHKKCSIKSVLQSNQSPLVEMIKIYTRLNTIFNKTVRSIQQYVIKSRNFPFNLCRIYPRNVTLTKSGRITMLEPNLQNIAKNFEINIPEITNCIISCRSPFVSDHGKCLLAADFCQLEMRILGHLSNDYFLKSMFTSYNDVFTAIAARWSKTKEVNVSNNMRDNAKKICYGIIYGMGIKALACALQTNEAEALTLYEQFHDAFPGIRLYTNRLLNFVRKTGYVETITGRRRYLININSKNKMLKAQAERQAINATIQGSAADILKLAIRQMHKNIFKYRTYIEKEHERIKLVLHLHDELIFEVCETELYRISRILRDSMEKCIHLNIPLLVKLKSGKSWGALFDIV